MVSAQQSTFWNDYDADANVLLLLLLHGSGPGGFANAAGSPCHTSTFKIHTLLEPHALMMICTPVRGVTWKRGRTHVPVHHRYNNGCVESHPRWHGLVRHDAVPSCGSLLMSLSDESLVRPARGQSRSGT